MAEVAKRAEMDRNAHTKLSWARQSSLCHCGKGSKDT